MLSLDFFRSRVSISAHVLVPWIRSKGTGKGTITPRIEVYNRPYADVYDAEETLVLLLELLLVKDLNRKDALFVHPPEVCISIGVACAGVA